MAWTTPTQDAGPKGIFNSAYNQLDPSKYTALEDFIKQVNAPDIRASLVKTFGDQGITGFLSLTGAVNNAGTADEVTYWEEARLHQRQLCDVAADISTGDTSASVDAMHAIGGSGYDEDGSGNQQLIARKGDILLLDGARWIVDADPTIDATTGAASLSIECLASGGAAAARTAASDTGISLPIIGNMFAQGTDQPDRYLESNVVKRTNPYAIVKETFKVTGSQATNIGYIDLGGGDYRWYIKGEQDTRQRFMDKREMTLLLGQKATNASAGVDGTEGYFAAVEDRGIVTTDLIGTNANSFSDLDDIVTLLDKQGAPAEYAMYCNTAQMLKLDDMIASGGTSSTAAGLSVSYGAFNNDKDMAVNLGFKSFSRGGYTFHKHNWKLLNDPTLLDGQGFAGAMIPLANVVDAKTGNRAPALEMNYKAANGYSREMEHWVTGGGVLGFNTDSKDAAQFNYRSECNLITRAANQHVLIKQ